MLKRLLCFLFLMYSSALFAQFNGGDGSFASPYEVATADQLYAVRNYSSSYFIQTADIDLSSYSAGEGWLPIPVLTGCYNGQYHTISNLNINRPGESNLGLFDIINGENGGGSGSVKNLVLLNVNITSYNNAGALAASIINGATIVNCGAEVTIFGSYTIGGLIGTSNVGCWIDNSYVKGSVTGNTTVGGIVAQTSGSGNLCNCYFKGTITGWGDSPSNLAGISGTINSSTISNCYATGAISQMSLAGVTANDNSNSTVWKCYINEDFFLGDNGIGTKISTASMQSSLSYSEWDFAGESVNGNGDYWNIDPSENDGYPYLTWEELVGVEPQMPQATNITLAELGWTQIRLTWTNGTGDRRAVYIKQGTGSYTPQPGWYSINRTVGAEFPDNGWYCVYDGTGNSIVIKGLAASTQYTVQVFEYDGEYGTQTFNTDVVADENSSVFSTIAEGFDFAIGDLGQNIALIKCADQLRKVNEMGYQYYRQENDIDLDGFSDGEGWVPLRNVFDNEFYGFYDGQGYEIRNLYINDPDGSNIGLFSTTWCGSEIKNVRLVDVDVTGQYAVGGLVGWGRTTFNAAPGKITNCSVSGVVNGQSAVGGLVGSISGGSNQPEHRGNIKYCSSTASVNGTFQYAGGLVGTMEYMNIYNCYATGNVTGNGGVGGLVGNMNYSGYIFYCYSLGTVTGSSSVGNLLGNYSDGIGSGTPNNGRIQSSYFNTDIEPAKRGFDEYGFPLTSDQFKDPENNLWGWDFVNVWNINSSVNNGFPYLQYVEPTAPVTQTSNISFADVTTSSMTINWTNGSGTARVVFMKRIGTGGSDPTPLNIITYTPNSSFGSGSEMASGSNWYCVYNGTGTSASVNNLSPGTQYSVKIFEYNGPEGSQVYNNTDDAGNSGSQSTTSDFSAGNGTEEDPYQLTSITDFLYMRFYSGRHFKLTGNIDLSGYTDNGGWTPFGDNNTPFNNNFDGNGFTIDGLYIDLDNPVGTSYMGLFGSIASGVEIKNVKLTNVNITAQSYVGALAGKNEGTITNCQVLSGTITIPGNNMEVFAGGLIGTNSGSLDNCFTNVTINGNNNSTIGGLIGYADGTEPGAGTITQCYSTGQVTGSMNIGGIAGTATSNAAISNCYSLSNINATDYCGGLVGNNSSNISYCYSIGVVNASSPTHAGAFLGDNNSGIPTITSCYWNIETAGLVYDPAATVKTTTEMTTEYLSNYTDWDFAGTWSVDPGINSGYPFLQSSDVVLPVELTSFTAAADGNKVKLSWTTATEINNYGFEVERSLVIGHQSLEKQDNPQSARRYGKILNQQWELVGFVEGSGNSNSPKKYSFEDANAPAGNLQYRLKQIDLDGKFTYYTSIAEVNFILTGVEENQLPTEYALGQNYPNPFNPSTVISYQLPVNGNVTLKVYDVLGNEVATLVNEQQQPGYYNIKFNGNNLSSGVYIYRLTAGSFTSTKKLILMK